MANIKVTGLGELDKLTDQLDDLLPNIRKLTNDGKIYALQKAPKYSGDLKRGIRALSTSDGKTGIIRSELPKGRNKSGRPYHMWMNGYKIDNYVNIAPFIKSGEPNYMELTFKKLENDVDKDIDIKLSKL